jgi:hypothetical protein
MLKKNDLRLGGDSAQNGAKTHGLGAPAAITNFSKSLGRHIHGGLMARSQQNVKRGLACSVGHLRKPNGQHFGSTAANVGRSIESTELIGVQPRARAIDLFELV